jgi:penicillin-binding protein 1A
MRSQSRRKVRKRRRMLRAVALGALLFVLFCLGMIAGIVSAYSRNLPDISRMADYQPARATRLFAADGTLLGSVYKENRIWVPISQIPKVVQEAFIANEDHNFYHHHGVDYFGIIRAAIADVTHQQIEQGASTITQQLARALFLNDQVTIQRKIEEALLAMEIERYYTKDEILDRYLNIIYLGSGAYGVDAAAHTYFGTSARNLTLGQAAMLAGLPAAPSDYSPFVNFKLARDRQKHVLDRMVDSGYITRAQAGAAFAKPVGLMSQPQIGLQSYKYPWFTTYAIAQLEKTFGKEAVKESGLQAYTTLNPHLEQIAQEAVDWGVRTAEREGINAHEGALVAIQPSTGDVVAMIGGTHFSLNNQFNRAWQAYRQPGSSMKAYLYTAAIDSGLAASSTMDDSPVSYPMGDGTYWSPHNDDLSYMGTVTLRTALALSRNVVAVKLANRIGVDKLIAYAKRMGVTAPLQDNLSLALGTSGITVLDQAAGYATLADQGIHNTPTPFRIVKDSFGNIVLDDRFPQSTEAVSAGTAYVVTTMLEDVINHGTGYPNAIIGRPAAGKTGTTSDFRDAWFVGYTPDLVTAVWIGNDNYSRMVDSYGGDVPARIWARFMKAALANTPPDDFVFPSDEVVRVASCDTGTTDFYLVGTQPTSRCSRVLPPPTPYPAVAAASAATASPTATPIDSPAPAPASPTPTP